jgi:hypothetical protein
MSAKRAVQTVLSDEVLAFLGVGDFSYLREQIDVSTHDSSLRVAMVLTPQRRSTLVARMRVIQAPDLGNPRPATAWVYLQPNSRISSGPMYAERDAWSAFLSTLPDGVAAVIIEYGDPVDTDEVTALYSALAEQGKRVWVAAHPGAPRAFPLVTFDAQVAESKKRDFRAAIRDCQVDDAEACARLADLIAGSSSAGSPDVARARACKLGHTASCNDDSQ